MSTTKITAIGLGIVLTIAVVIVVDRRRAVLPCPTNAAIAAFWAQDRDAATSEEREREIRRELPCVRVIGKTKAQAAKIFGPPTDLGAFGPDDQPYEVWSNGPDTAGIYVEFISPQGKATKAVRYDPGS